jgi:citrate lyase subunit beta/citryl-CoA lyase
MEPIRSMLFAPASRPDVAAKAMGSAADSVIVDLEDSVPLDRKEEARAFVRELEAGDLPVYVRTNGPETEFFWDDVVAATRPGIDGLVIPKVESGGSLTALDGGLTALEHSVGMEPGTVEVIPMIESAAGVIHIWDIVTQPRVVSIFVGSAEQGDLVADLGCEWTPDGVGMLTVRGQCLAAARAAGIKIPIDGVFMNLADEDALRQECLLALRLGYWAKAVIHPRQIPVVHEVFTPDEEEVARQRAIIEAFDRALAEGQAAVSVEGKMVDYATARVARSIVERGDFAAEMDARGK